MPELALLWEPRLVAKKGRWTVFHRVHMFRRPEEVEGTGQWEGTGPSPGELAERRSVQSVAHQAWRKSHREQRGERAWTPVPGQRARIL